MDILERIKESDMILVGIGEELNDSKDAVSFYEKLSVVLEGKNYFIVTLCTDDVIRDSKLKQDRIVAPLGTRRKLQCPDACDNALFEPNETVCPKCGKLLVYNDYKADNYIEDGYLPMWELHKKWLTGTLNKSLTVLEFGVSMNIPQIIRWPFERICFLNNKAYFVRINKTLWQLDENLNGKGEGIESSSYEWLHKL